MDFTRSKPGILKEHEGACNWHSSLQPWGCYKHVQRYALSRKGGELVTQPFMNPNGTSQHDPEEENQTCGGGQTCRPSFNGGKAEPPNKIRQRQQ